MIPTQSWNCWKVIMLDHLMFQICQIYILWDSSLWTYTSFFICVELSILWALSFSNDCFVFEDLNGFLVWHIHRMQLIDNQVLIQFMLYKLYSSWKRTYRFYHWLMHLVIGKFWYFKLQIAGQLLCKRGVVWKGSPRSNWFENVETDIAKGLESSSGKLSFMWKAG